ncbi:hypothetical protein [Bradyrhizobium sp. P5_C11_2]
MAIRSGRAGGRHEARHLQPDIAESHLRVRARAVKRSTGGSIDATGYLQDRSEIWQALIALAINVHTTVDLASAANILQDRLRDSINIST